MRVAAGGFFSGGRTVAVLTAICAVAGACEGSGRAAGEGAPPAEAESPNRVAAATNLPPGLNAEEVERGRELFLPCAVCHGLDGNGNQLGPSLRDTTWIHVTGTLEEIEQVIRDGVLSPKEYPVPMVPMGGGDFDAAELRAVASYVYAISHR